MYMADVITIYCKNTKKYYDVPRGSTLLDIYKTVGEPLPYRPMNAQVNHKTEDLTFVCWHPKDIEFVDYTNLSGIRTYVRSLCFILSKAVHDVYPEATLNLEHSISKGYYCTIHNGAPADAEMLLQIKKRMHELVDADMPFKLHTIQTEKAIELFHSVGMDDKANLIKTSGMLYTSYYELDGYINYFYGGLVPSTGYVELFDLEPYMDGALLRVPMQNNPKQLAPKVWQKKMYEVYKEHLTLQHALGLNNVGDLNIALKKGFASDVIMISEAMQEKQIARIADEIAEQYEKGVRIVLISGPSSSGKTTTCKRLEVQLATNLLHPVGISLDDYFVNREDTPKDENGESGKRVYRGKKMKLRDHSIIVIEGIHALNPELTAYLDDSLKYRIYVSALTSISLDNHNWIPTTDNRLLRRIIRDYRFRGYSAEDTILRWPSVRRGEDKWIFPYQEYADAMFNSAMLYELAALRVYAEPILANVQESSPANAEAYRLLRFLRYFNYIPQEELPKTSLLREFLGGGSFKY